LLLDTALAACDALSAVQEGRAAADPPRTLAPHRDLSLAMVFGARSALAFLAVACFWLATAWPAASGALLLTCVVCSLFASRENGAQIGMSFLRGILLAVPTAFVIGEIMLPQWSSFAMLGMAMGVPLFLGALCMAKPPLYATATSFCLHFVVLVSPLNTMKYDVATFFNNAQAMMIGVGAAVLAFNLLILRNPAWHSRRLLAATLDDLVRLTHRSLRGAESWFGGRMADRLLQLARHYPELPVPSRSRWDDGLLGLDIGDELLHLRLSLAVAQVPESPAQRHYFETLEQVLERGPAGDQGDALAQASDEYLRVLSQQPKAPWCNCKTAGVPGAASTNLQKGNIAMGLREWSIGGVLLSPFLIYVVLALLVTGGLRLLLSLVPAGRWIWHEALFDCALYVCVLTVITRVLGPL
jgi:uncharacterized membrane protein YccC